MARPLTFGFVVLLTACPQGEAVEGRCTPDGGGCRAGLVCRFDGVCAMTECNPGELVACESGPYVARRACANGSLGPCSRVQCANDVGACMGALLLLSEADSGCGRLSYAAGNSQWRDRDECDGIDNDCDGEIDEYDPPDGGNDRLCPLQAGICAGAQRRCGDETVCSPQTYQAHSSAYRLVETNDDCDGVDNDCDGVADEYVDPGGGPAPLCPKQLGVCDGARRQFCNEPPECFASTYRARAGDAGFEEFEVRCDGADNDCDGLPDISREKSLGPGTEVTLLGELHEPAPTVYRAIVVDGALRSKYFTATLDPNGETGNPIAAPAALAPRAMVDAAQNSRATWVTWRTTDGYDVAAINRQTVVIPHPASVTSVRVGPRILAPMRVGAPDDDAVVLWDDGANVKARPFRFNAPLVPEPSSEFPISIDDLDVAQGAVGLAVYKAGSLLGAATVSFGPPSADGGDLVIGLGQPNTDPALLQVQPRILRAAQCDNDYRYFFSNLDGGHNFSGQPNHLVESVTAALPVADEGRLVFGRSRDGGPGRGWFVQRSGAGVYAVFEGQRTSFFMLSDAGLNGPAVAWSARDETRVAVAYPVLRRDGGSEIMGRLLCAPR
jgi:hypothetical protein